MTAHIPPIRTLLRALGAFGLLLSASALSQTQALTPAELVATLKAGGLVIVLRHASLPRAIPDKTTANADNTTPERQLDEVGRSTATAMGKAIRELKIPIGAVLSSPTYRALETVRLAGLPAPSRREELGDGGSSMQGVGVTQGHWLRQQAALPPKSGNTLIVTHFPNINAAFPEYAQGLADGEALVFGADGAGGSALRARIKIDQWPTLAK